jgi:hypothetical protein
MVGAREYEMAQALSEDLAQSRSTAANQPAPQNR